MFAEIMLLLHLGHLAADYPLQPDWQAAAKARPGRAGWRANAAHALTHVAACGVALAVGALALDLNILPVPAALALAWIGASHSLIDRRWPIAWWMRHARQEKWAANGGAAHVDQTAHVLALGIAALALAA